jgi:homoprotocatechuate degradation regulator HpaR
MRAFANSLPMALLRGREAVMRQFRPGLRTHGVTEQQWRVLRALLGHTALEITELARETCLLLPSLSRILPQLESRSLVVRHPVPGDLRRANVTLTAAGMTLIAAHAPRSEAVYRTIEQRFGSERLMLLFELLRRLEHSLATLPTARRRDGGARRAAPRGARPRVAGGGAAEVRKG